MKWSRLKVALVAIAIAIVLPALLIGYAGSGPRYQGKTARAWALQLGAPVPQPQAEAAQALRKMGSSAARPLSRMLLNTNRALFDQTFLTVVPRLPVKIRLPLVLHFYPVDPGQARVRAAEALGIIGTEARAAIPALIKTLAVTNDDMLLFRVATALGNIGGDAVAPLLTKLRSDSGPKLHHWAFYALGLMGQQAKDAVPVLLAGLNDPDYQARSAAETALGRIGGATPALLEMLRSQEPAERELAIHVLAETESFDEDAIGAIIEAAQQDKEPAVRRQAIESIDDYFTGYPATLPILTRALGDTDAQVRLTAIKGLGKIGPAAKPTLAGLERALDDREPSVRAAAAAAIKTIIPPTVAQMPR